MMFVPWTEVDSVWKSLVEGLLDGKFEDDLGVLYIRIRGRSDPEVNPHNSGTDSSPNKPGPKLYLFTAFIPSNYEEL